MHENEKEMESIRERRKVSESQYSRRIRVCSISIILLPDIGKCFPFLIGNVKR